MKTKHLRAILLSLLLPFTSGSARASIAYGSINNFDTVNDTGHECHGFEIELEDCHSTDITYTYNYNHYGVPKITQDDSVAGHPKCIIRWESKKNPDGSWAAYTAIPAGPIDPTNGHMFTNPNVNFGGEHFGAGYVRQPAAIRYHWLIDDGTGNLMHGGAVQVATPAFTYYPAAGGAPAQVQAAIQPPEPPEVHVLEFGEPVWVKEIRTSSHNNREVKLRDLVSDDPDDPDDRNWRNDEPDEVEVEWQLLQTEFNKVDGGNNGELVAAPEDLENGDEVVTRRYEFFKYTGPIDNETGEAMCDNVGADGVHGDGVGEVNGVEVDFSTVEVVGEYTGAQMAAVDVDAGVGLTEHLGDGSIAVPYAARSVVIQGAAPFTASLTGALPAGMTFNAVTGVLSGTPMESGEFTCTVKASDANTPEREKTYTFSIAAAGQELAPRSLLDTASEPVAGGATTGSDSYPVDGNATVTATPNPGWRFVHWEEGGGILSLEATFTLTMNINHSLVAKFTPSVPQWNITVSAAPAEGGTTTGGGAHDDGASVTVTATPAAGYVFVNWKQGANTVSSNPSYTFTVSADRVLVANFTADTGLRTITTSSNPAAGGTTSGAGSYAVGAPCTLTATPNANYMFKRWQVSGTTVSNSATYTFTVSANLACTARFVRIYPVITSSNPPDGGTTGIEGSFEDGDDVIVTATANPGYVFANWTENGVMVSADPVYEFNANPARTLVANFSADGFSVAAGSSFAPGGTVGGGGIYAAGEAVTVTATPAPHYEFTGWSQGGAIVSTAPAFTFDATASVTVTAHFQPVVEFLAGPVPKLSWPESAAGWQLQESTDLGGAWTNSAAPVTQAGDMNEVTVSPNQPRCFYRLLGP